MSYSVRISGPELAGKSLVDKVRAVLYRHNNNGIWIRRVIVSRDNWNLLYDWANHRIGSKVVEGPGEIPTRAVIRVAWNGSWVDFVASINTPEDILDLETE